MTASKWQDEIAVGRVFELRSKSVRYPAPCVLIVNDDRPHAYSQPMAVAMDRFGVIGSGMYRRAFNPGLNIYGLKRKDFTSSKIVRRRPELERFDAEDIAVIRYGLAVDFGGRLHGGCGGSMAFLPPIAPATWTIFWSYNLGWDLMREEKARLDALLSGAWHFDLYGGSQRLGFKYGCAWATRHEDPRRLSRIEHILRDRLGHLVRQEARVVSDGKYIFEVRPGCPALAGRIVHSVDADFLGGID